VNVLVNRLCERLRKTTLPATNRDEFGDASEALCQVFEFLEAYFGDSSLKLPKKADPADIVNVLTELLSGQQSVSRLQQEMFRRGFLALLHKPSSAIDEALSPLSEAA